MATTKELRTSKAKGRNGKVTVGASANVTTNMPGYEEEVKSSNGYGHVDFLSEVLNTDFKDVESVENELYVVAWGGVSDIFAEHKAVFDKINDEQSGGAKLKLIVVDTNNLRNEHDFPKGSVYINVGKEYGINGLRGTIQPELLEKLVDKLIEKWETDEELCNAILWRSTKDQKQFEKPATALMVLGGAGGTGAGALFLSRYLDNIARPHIYLTMFESNVAGSLNKHKYLLTNVMNQAQVVDNIVETYKGEEIIHVRPALSAACIDTAINGKKYARDEVAAMTAGLLLMLSSTSADISDVAGYAGGSTNSKRGNVCDIKIVYGDDNEVTNMDVIHRHSSMQYTPTGDSVFQTLKGDKVSVNPHETITMPVAIVAIPHNLATLKKRIAEYEEAAKKLAAAEEENNSEDTLSILSSIGGSI